MAISGNIKTAYDARLVAAELKNAAAEIALGILMTGGLLDPMAIVHTLDTVADDFIKWSEGVNDNDEVFMPVGMVAELNQLRAEVNDFHSTHFHN